MKKKRWARWNSKLDRYDITIDLAELRTISQRALQTGYVSRKVLKKWRKRGGRVIAKGCCSRHKKECVWLPATVMKDPYFKLDGRRTFWWACKNCRSVTEWVWEHELSEPMLNAYREHTRKHGAEEED